MKRKLIAVLLINLLAASLTHAQQGLRWTGEASFGLRLVDENARDPSKFREYRDLDDDPITVLDVRGENDERRYSLFLENITQDDRYIDIRAVRFGIWAFRLYDNELRHRFGSGPGALSPYAGVGGDTLTATFPRLNVGTWNPFDDSLKRRDTGLAFEWAAQSPWYFRADGNQVSRDGVKVIGGSQGTSPGNGNVDLPAPVDWKTRNVSGEVGYQAQDRHFAISAFYSSFENRNDLLRWSNGFFAPAAPMNYDRSVLPPDNELFKIAANGNLRGLPWGSTLAGRITYGKLTNDVAVLPTMLAASPPLPAPQVGTNPSTGANVPLFQGEIVTTTASLSLNSHPMRALDTRLYYNYREKDNDSTHVTFTPTAASGLQCGGQPCEPELFGYSKHNAGVEANYRLGGGHRIGGGYDYYRTERDRLDFPKTIENRYFVEWRNSSLDYLDTRVKYQYLQRRSVAFPYADPGNPIDAFVRRFDYANLNQHSAKFRFDVNPMPLLDLGFDVILKHNDFKDTPLGRTKDWRQEYYASVGFGDPNSLRVAFFGDLEVVKYDSRHRVGVCAPDPDAPPQSGSGTGASPCSPPGAVPPPHTTYTWTADNEDRSWQVGAAVDWLPYEKLTIKGSLVWAETKGSVDFAAQPGTILAAPFLSINNFDNTRRLALNLRGIYDYTQQWQFTGGYAFERYRYDDVGYNGFAYVIPAGAGFTQTSYFTGQGAFQPYNAHIFYTYVTYRF